MDEHVDRSVLTPELLDYILANIPSNFPMFLHPDGRPLSYNELMEAAGYIPLGRPEHIREPGAQP